MTRLSRPFSLCLLSSMTCRWCRWAGTAALVLWLAMTPAYAQIDACTEAAASIRRALSLRTAHQDEAALAELKQAEAVCPTPQTQAQIALAEQALGRWLDAAEHLTAALAAADDPWIKKHRGALESAWTVIDQHLGHLEVQVEPAAAGTSIIVNGESHGTLPLSAPIRVVSGTVVLEVQAPGYSPIRREVNVPPGGLAREQVQLTSLPPAPARTLALTLAKAAPAAVTPPPAAPSRARVLSRRLGIVGVVAGAVLLGGGAAAQAIRERAAQAWNADDTCVQAQPAERSPACSERLHRITVGQTLAIVGYAAGGALAASGILLLALPDRVWTRHPRDRAQLQLVPGPGEMGLGLAGTF